jgi:ferredoxin
MPVREIVKIDEEKCDGCGLCVPNCAEGAIKIINGKAKVITDALCDGLGACLGHCPQDAITIIKRDADGYDVELVKEEMKKEGKVYTPHEHEHSDNSEPLACGCPGSAARTLKRVERPEQSATGKIESELIHWPVQMHLVPAGAPYFKGADILLTADCVPFAYADFHRKLLKGKPVIIGCPKLDDAKFYVDKLTQILKQANPNSLTVIHMEVPCCSGLIQIARMAKEKAGIEMPIYDLTITVDGHLK